MEADDDSVVFLDSVNSDDVIFVGQIKGPDPDAIPPVIDVESTVEADIQKKVDTILCLFADIDPAYARELSTEYAFRQEDFENYIAEFIERGQQYPTANVETDKSSSEPVREPFSINEFLEKYPQPLEFFLNRNRENSNLLYTRLSMEYLKDKFRYSALCSIRDALERNKNNLTKTVKDLETRPRSRKSKRNNYEVSTIQTFNQDFEDEMNFLEHETEINEYLRHKTDERMARIEEARNLGALLTCGCCYNDELLVEDMLSCGEGHLFCRTCLKSHANIIIGEEKIHFPCLQECTSQFTYDSIQAVVKKQVYEKLLRRAQEFEVKSAGIEGLEFCPFCEYAEIPPEGDKIFKCKNCKKESCRLCHELSHIPYKCEEAVEKRLTSARTQVEEKISEFLIRRCPKCQRKFIKADGCNKMTCSCGATSCYLCRQLVNSYNHFDQKMKTDSAKCPLYSKNEELHVDLIEREAMKLKAEAVAKEPALDSQLDLLKGLRRAAPKKSSVKRGRHVFHFYQEGDF